MFKTIALSFVALLVVASTNASADQVVRGRYFTFVQPDRWVASETLSGVTLYSFDGVSSAGTIGLRGTPGRTTPEAFVVRTLQLCGATNIRILQRNRAAFLPGYIGAELVYSFTSKEGVNSIGWSACWINNDAVSYDAILQHCSTAADQWPDLAAHLKDLATRVSVVPGSGAICGR